MKNMHTLIKALEMAEDNFLQTTKELLCLPVNFPSILYNYVLNMSDQLFYEYYLRGCYDERSPEIFLLYDDPK